MEYADLKKTIQHCLNLSANHFFDIGRALREIREQGLYKEDGYRDIWDFAKGEYGLSASSTSRFMAINERFSINGGQTMAPKYIGMGPSKLQEMLGLSDEDLEKVTPETTVREIRAMKAKPVSPCDLRAAVREEGSPSCDVAKERPEPSEKDIAAFYRWAGFTTKSSIDADDLKKTYRHSGGGGFSDLKDYQGSARGIRINYKRELTYCQLAKRLTEYQEKLRQADKPAGMTDAEKDALLKEKEPDMIASFYRRLYPGEREIIKKRNAAEITKMFKTEYGETYEGERDENGLLWNCFPDKINFSISGLCRPLQITWGRLTTKLLALLAQRPELEADPNPEPEKEPEQTVIEDTEPEDDPESYTGWDVRQLLNSAESTLEQYYEADMPADTIRERVIMRDALVVLLERLEG